MLAAVSALDRERDRWLADWEAFGVRLSVAIARKILRRELELHPENVKEMLSETLRLAAGSTNIVLRLHPDDVQLLRNRPEDLASSMSGCAEAAIVPDPSVERGGCIVDCAGPGATGPRRCGDRQAPLPPQKESILS